MGAGTDGARRLVAGPLVLEKAGRPGGSMRLSKGRDLATAASRRFRGECPDGDEGLQRLSLSDSTATSMARVARRSRGRAHDRQPTDDRGPLRPGGDDGRAGGGHGGCAAGPMSWTRSLRRAASRRTPVISRRWWLRGHRELLEEHVSPEAGHAFLRAAPGSTGDGLRVGLAAGAAPAPGSSRSTRAMPAPPANRRGRPRSALTALRAHARSRTGAGRVTRRHVV